MQCKSPFLVIQDFISPYLCEQIVDGLNFIEPDVDSEHKVIKQSKENDRFEDIIFEAMGEQMDNILEHFDVEYRGTKAVDFWWYPEEVEADSGYTCENAVFTGSKQWVKNKDRDLTCVLFLSDYNDKIPFESEYEVYGGKLEFPQHQFGFHAERGTLIVYPSGPHFLNQIQGILAGDLFFAKYHLATQLPYIYDPRNFPGDYTTWFEEIA